MAIAAAAAAENMAQALEADGQARDARCLHAIGAPTGTALADLRFDPAKCHILFGAGRFQSTSNSKRRVPYFLWWKRHLGSNFPVTHDMLEKPVWASIDQSCTHGLTAKNGHSKVKEQICINPYHYNPTCYDEALKALSVTLMLLPPEPQLSAIMQAVCSTKEKFHAVCAIIRGLEEPFLDVQSPLAVPSAVPSAPEPLFTPDDSWDFQSNNLAAYALNNATSGVPFMASMLQRGFSQPMDDDDDDDDDDGTVAMDTEPELASANGSVAGDPAHAGVDLSQLVYTGLNSYGQGGSNFEACGGLYIPSLDDPVAAEPDITDDEALSIDGLKKWLQELPSQCTLFCHDCMVTYTVANFTSGAQCPYGHAHVTVVDVPQTPLVGYGADIAYMAAKARPNCCFVEGDVVGFFDSDNGTGTVIDLITADNHDQAKLAGIISRSAYLIANAKPEQVPEDAAKAKSATPAKPAIKATAGNEALTLPASGVPSSRDVVCMIGYVKVKVRGPVRNGDLLYTDLSDESMPGVAVAGLDADHPDALLIGQALDLPADAAESDDDSSASSSSDAPHVSNTAGVTLVKCLVSLVANMVGKHTRAALQSLSHQLQTKLDAKIHAALAALKQDVARNTERSKSNEERVATLEGRLQELESRHEKLLSESGILKLKQAAGDLDGQQLQSRENARRRNRCAWVSTDVCAVGNTVLFSPAGLRGNNNLRVNNSGDNSIEPAGARGRFARWLVCAGTTDGQFRLQNDKRPCRWMQLAENRLVSCTKSEATDFITEQADDQTVYFKAAESGLYVTVDSGTNECVGSKDPQTCFKLLKIKAPVRAEGVDPPTSATAAATAVSSETATSDATSDAPPQ